MSESEVQGLFWLGIGLLLVIGYFKGLARLGFSAGLAWFVATTIFLGLVWPIGLLIALAIAAYGFGKQRPAQEKQLPPPIPPAGSWKSPGLLSLERSAKLPPPLPRTPEKG